VLPVLAMARFSEFGEARLMLASFAVPLAAVVGGSVFFNTFGMEREAVAATFLQPTDRRVVLMGKNLGDGLVLVLVVGPVVLLTALVVEDWRLAAGGVLALLLAVPCVGAVANYWAVEFPFRTPKRGENPFQTGFLAMWLVGLIHMLGVGVAGLLAAPGMLLLALGFLAAGGRYLPLTFLLAAGYSVLVYWLLLGGAAQRLIDSEPEILETVRARTRRWAG